MSSMDKSDFDYLVEAKVITTEDLNLRSKIESITRSLEALASKRARIDYEIKKQKISLTRKREELKRVTKRNHVKLSVSLESGSLIHELSPEDCLLELQRYDAKLLQESDQALGD